MEGRERAQRAADFEGPDRVPIMHSVLFGAFHKYGDELRKLISALSGYEFPDPEMVGDWDRAAENAAKAGDKLYVIGKGGEYFERMQWLRGFENLMFDFAEGREELNVLGEEIVMHNLKVLEMWQASGADLDAVQFGDDWGSQMQLMLRPSIWREFFKPNYKRMFDLAHEFGWRVHFHSDGHISEIIPDLVEIGVDVLNVQLPVMDLAELGRELKGKVCVRGGLDRQKILPRGTPKEVKSHVREVYSAFGSPEGGWIGNGEIGPDVPLENARAMYEEIVELG